MIYELEFKEFKFKHIKILFLIPALWVSCTLIFFLNDYSYELLGDSFDLSKINNFILILIVIIFTYLCHNIFIKGPIICEEKKNKDLMYSLIGLDELHSKFFLELKDDNLIIFSKNIENTIFYNEIEKIFFKKDGIILFLKNRVNITIPKTSEFEELSHCLKSKLEK